MAVDYFNLEEEHKYVRYVYNWATLTALEYCIIFHSLLLCHTYDVSLIFDPSCMLGDLEVLLYLALILNLK